MDSVGLEDILTCVPHAVARVDAKLQVLWLDPEFNRKTNVSLQPGQSLLELLERGKHRDALELAVRNGQRFTGSAITCALHQVLVRVQPCREPYPGQAWVLVEPLAVDDPVAFAQALQEIARSVGEILDVDAVCAAAVMSMVRCAHVSRAEVYLVEGRNGLRRVALSDVAGSGISREKSTAMEVSLKQAVASGEAQIGIARGNPNTPATIFAAIPLIAQKQTTGLLLLHKAEGAAFTAREIDLWSAAAGQLAVAVENARLLREAQAALRMRDEFMSIASHELRTPLTPLKMSLYTMERKIAAGDPVALSTVIKAKRQVDRLTSLVTDLLDASRAEMGKLTVKSQPLDFNQLLVEVTEQFRGAYDRPLLLEMPQDRLWVMGDRDRLEQVLVNLLENAQKYSPEGSPVTVKMESEGESVLVRVEDRGIGIPVGDQEKIFQRFHRAQNVSPRNFAGLGLGLYISESIMRMHQGGLAVSSAEGEGSVFSARLPRLTDAEVAALPRKLLLLEEDVVQRAEATQLLRDAGFDVHVQEPAEALRNLVAAPLDLIVVSTTLDGPTRELFLQTLTAMPLARPIPLLFSGKGLPGWATAENCTVCPKPYHAAPLQLAVRRSLGEVPEPEAAADGPRAPPPGDLGPAVSAVSAH